GLPQLGHRTRTLRLPQERRKTGVQAFGLSRSRSGSGARHRAGQHDEAGRALWRQAAERAAHAVPAHPVELHAGLVSPAEDAQCAVFQPERLRIVVRRRRFRPAGNLHRPRRLTAGGERRGRHAAGTDPAGDRGGDPGPSRPSTRSVSDALLGRHGRGRNGCGHGLFGGQRQDALFPGSPGPQQSTEGKGITTM
ncbi:MAG: DNA-directed RNA polymerase specialized sigma subunit, sigma24-like, partial [uncultured Ramlibacter sp.]